MVIERRRSRLGRGIQEELIKYFCAGVTARAAAEVSGVNRNTAVLFYHKLREVIFAALEAEAPELLAGEIEVDESYFGGHRKGKRGRGAAGKVPVFGLLKRQGKVYVAIIANARSDTLIPIIREKIRPDSLVYTDAFGSYDVLDVSEFHHMRINHSKLFADQRNHINPVLSLPKGESRTSGTRRSGISGATMAYRASTSTCSSRSANGASTTVPSRVCRQP
jgi:transposase